MVLELVVFWPQKFFKFFPISTRSGPSFAKIVSTPVRYLLERWSASALEIASSMSWSDCWLHEVFLRNIKKSGLSSDCWWNKNPAHVDMVNIRLFTGFLLHPRWLFGISSISSVNGNLWLKHLMAWVRVPSAQVRLPLLQWWWRLCIAWRGWVPETPFRHAGLKSPESGGVCCVREIDT